MTTSNFLNPLKIVTFNVHGWYDSAFSGNIPRVVSLLHNLQPDLVAFQEVQGDAQRVAEKMGSPWKSYFASTLGNFGNAIISNLNIISTYSHILDVDDAEPRGVIGVTLNHPILKLVFNTHLDHINENVRMKQLEELFSALESHTNVPHIIMGDFNALSKEDYSQDYFDRYVYSVRFRNGWELPKFDVIDFIKGKGYVDCWRQLNPDAKDRSTCRFGTRIDYIFASASLVPLIDWTKSSCEIYHDSSNASDHEPVILTLFFNNNYNNNNNNNNHVLSQPTANIEQTN